MLDTLYGWLESHGQHVVYALGCLLMAAASVALIAAWVALTTQGGH
jgi:hypothetical protein